MNIRKRKQTKKEQESNPYLENVKKRIELGICISCEQSKTWRNKTEFYVRRIGGEMLSVPLCQEHLWSGDIPTSMEEEFPLGTALANWNPPESKKGFDPHQEKDLLREAIVTQVRAN